ncbi:hypothetical protein NF556_10210 [Ornithinimicrobium faecis]|uniref:Pyrroloquinoline-quinone binding quinoprotein n=1 Tax=Ornithinimicrobium faecis TaxID=2934158 RepID=A0ABY4YZ06_9MICO|nr:hypothetical protein [Ornithinimicrobium sp. HY1793]USQ81989.1 hypothetical protein NF556_10210 [Ornithinimicrobium sp. HY1793]
MTPHRKLTAAATVGILLLSACSTVEPDAPDDVTTTTITALDRDPHPVTSPVPEADTTGLWLPLSFQESRILDPGWDTDVLSADGVFLGASTTGDHVEFTAIDVHGEILWAAERPSGSIDFEVRSDNGSAIAALPDTDPDGAQSVSGYDLVTGDRVWGPEQPPGPRAADSAEQTQSTTTDDGTHLDPGTRTRITLRDTTLRAEGSDGNELWTLSVEADTQVAGLAGGLLYLREGDAIRAHNVVTGAVAQAYDPEGEGRVVVPQMMVAQGADLLMDGERPLIAVAPEEPAAPGGPPAG